MFYLLLAIASSAMVSIIMRLSEKKTSCGIELLLVNYAMCSLLSLANTGSLAPNASLGASAALGAVNGLFYLGGFMLLQWNVRRNGVVLSATFMKLGLLVAMVISVCFFGEVPSLVQVIGFLIALAAIVLMNYQKGAAGLGIAKMGLIFMLVCGGMADGMSKIFEELGPAGYDGAFLFFTFFTAMVLCVVIMLARGNRPDRWEVFFGLLIGIPNFYSSKFLLRALQQLPAVIIYPVYSVGAILLISLVGVLAFRERLRKLQWLAMGLILVALVLLNL